MKLYCCEDRTGPFIDVFRRSAADSGYDLECIDGTGANPASFDEFKKHYVHRSFNSEDFELACFRRYFIVRKHVQPMQRFIICDSDLMLLAPVGPLLEKMNGTPSSLIASVGVANGISEDWISPHFSIWTTELLDDFLRYSIDAYAHEFDRLDADYKRRVAKKAFRPSISDMNILHFWVKDHKIPFQDSNRVCDALYIDHNLSMTECANHQFRSELGRKMLCLRDGNIRLLGRAGDVIVPVLLHLQGRYKIIANALYRRQMRKVRAYSTYIFCGRRMRSMIS